MTITDQDQLLCLICEEPCLPRDNDDYEDDSQYWKDSIFREGVVHEQCAHDNFDRLSVVVRYSPDGPEKVEFDEDIAYYTENDYTEEAYDKSELPQWFIDHFGEGRSWNSTDAWRGYLDVRVEGLVKVTDGWVTGWPDDSVSHKQPSCDFAELLQEGAVPPVVFYWDFSPSSNVFSMVVDIWTETEEDKETLLKWISEQLGVTTEQFERSFI